MSALVAVRAQALRAPALARVCWAQVGSLLARGASCGEWRAPPAKPMVTVFSSGFQQGLLCVRVCGRTCLVASGICLRGQTEEVEWLMFEAGHRWMDISLDVIKHLSTE